MKLSPFTWSLPPFRSIIRATLGVMTGCIDGAGAGHGERVDVQPGHIDRRPVDDKAADTVAIRS